MLPEFWSVPESSITTTLSKSYNMAMAGRCRPSSSGRLSTKFLDLRISKCSRQNSTATAKREIGDKREMLGKLPVNPMPQFNKLKILKEKEEKVAFKSFVRKELHEILPPRSQRLKPTQDWPSVWPAAQSFNSSVVPLPVRMGYQKKKKPENQKVAPAAYANLELMKIPNFLHLTPIAIKRQCEALKKFCTPWPEELKTPKEITENFPLTFLNSDYVHSGPIIRDPRARITTLQFKLGDLPLNYHARDKFIRLCGDKYSKKTDLVTISADRCPTRKQNTDYLNFVLTALFHESWTFEEWEKDKTEDDMERYFFRGKKAHDAVFKIMQSWLTIKENMQEEIKDAESEQERAMINEALQKFPGFAKTMDSASAEDILNLEPIKDYEIACESLRNADEETREIYRTYGKAVRKLYNFPDQLVPKSPYERSEKRQERMRDEDSD